SARRLQAPERVSRPTGAWQCVRLHSLFVLGHVGIGTRLLFGLRQRLPPRWLVLGCLLPDLIDKPLFYGLLWTRGHPDALISGSRSIAHSGLFLLALLALALALRRPGPWAVFAGVATHLAPGTRSNLLQPRASLADHDRLLAVALHENGGGDADEPAGAGLALGFVEQLDQDRRAVGNLLPGVAQELLADQLGAEIALLHVRPLLRGKHRRSLRQVRNQRIDEAVDVVTPERRQRVHVGPGVQVLPAIDQRKKLRPWHRIDLVDHQQRRFPGRFHLIERLAGRGVDGRRPCLDEEESEIRVGERL